MVKKITHILLLCVICQGLAQKVKVTVYYETYCRDSVKYLVKGVLPTYQKLSNYIDLDLVPFGHVKQTLVSGKVKFICQHGYNECKTNKYHGCAIQLALIDVAADFIYCDLASDTPADDFVLEKCADDAGIWWEILKNCFENDEGDEIMIANGERTNAAGPPVKDVPATFFNNKFSFSTNMDAKRNFLHIVCEFLDNVPSACD